MSFFQFRILSVLFLCLWAGSAGAYSLLVPQLDYEEHVFGPNAYSEMSGISAIDQGTWLPQGSARYGFLWLEPLNSKRLGSMVVEDPRYLRFEASGALSPYYSSFQMAIGVRPFHRFEVAGVYQVLAYFNSNVEQALPSNYNSLELSETWQSDYIWKHMYEKDGRLDYSQVFGLLASVDLSHKSFRAGGEYHFYLIDVRTENTQKNIDYLSMLPVDKRDFFFQALLWARLPITKRWAAAFDFEYEQTGLRTNIFGTYDKGSIPQGFLFAGGSLKLSKTSSLVVEPGYLYRPDRFMNSDVTQRFLVRLFWQGHWSWSLDR